MANTKKYISLDKLGVYDEKIKQYLANADTVTLKSAKDYADETLTLANNNAASLANTAEANAKAYADGKDAAIAEAKKAGTDAAAAASVADGKAVAAQTDIDNLETYVGTIPETAEATNIVAYVQEKTAGIATSENLQELTNRVAQAETDIDNIEKDYLKAADKTELEGKITTAQTAADSAQDYAEGVATDLATETSERKAADEAQVERIAALEGTIVGLSGAMHFEGVVETDPATITEGYENGDTVIYGNKEYVWNNGAFVEFGDASVNAEAITELTGRVSTAEGKITTAEGKITTLEGAVATKAEKTYVDEKAEALQGEDAAIKGRLDALEGAIGESGSVADDIATAKQEAIDTAAADATTKANTAESNAKAHADSLNTAMNTRVEALEAIDHDHSNKTVLDGITAEKVTGWDNASAKAHEHSNLSVLEGVTSAKVTAWDAAEGNAKTYADGLNDAVAARVTTLETWHNNFTEVSEDEINQLFQ